MKGRLNFKIGIIFRNFSLVFEILEVIFQKLPLQRSSRVCVIRVVTLQDPTEVGHHVDIPSALVPLFYGVNILMEALSLLIVTNSTQIRREPIEVVGQVVKPNVRPALQFFKACEHVPD